MAPYGYYLPLAPNLFDSVRYLDISPKTERIGSEDVQKTDKDGRPVWVVSALVKYQGNAQATESFTLVATNKEAETIRNIPELTPIKLIGLAGGKWSKAQSDKTSWSFQISGVQV